MNPLTKGIFYVALGASSFGMLASFVKLAYKANYTTAEVTLSQFALGILLIFLMLTFKSRTGLEKASTKNIKQLMISGTTLGFTSVLYYLCVKYINASIAVVLLMQSVWIGVVIEMFQTKKIPSVTKIIAVIIVLVGTVLATNILSTSIEINILGIIFGMLASISFSLTLFTTNSVATNLHPLQRSFFMLLGGACIVITFAFFTQIAPTYLNLDLLSNTGISTVKEIDFKIFLTYGIILSLFGTVLPPIFLNKGFPLTGVGLGSIISALELPVSVTFAYFLLSEEVKLIQWVGIILILAAIVLMNLNFSNKKSEL